MTFLMFLYSSYKPMLCYTAYIIINIKNFDESKKKKKKKNTNIVKNNKPNKTIIVRRLAEQHIIQKQEQAQKKNIQFPEANDGGWVEMHPNFCF